MMITLKRLSLKYVIIFALVLLCQQSYACDPNPNKKFEISKKTIKGLKNLLFNVEKNILADRPFPDSIRDYFAHIYARAQFESEIAKKSNLGHIRDIAKILPDRIHHITVPEYRRTFLRGLLVSGMTQRSAPYLRHVRSALIRRDIQKIRESAALSYAKYAYYLMWDDPKQAVISSLAFFKDNMSRLYDAKTGRIIALSPRMLQEQKMHPAARDVIPELEREGFEIMPEVLSLKFNGDKPFNLIGFLKTKNSNSHEYRVAQMISERGEKLLTLGRHGTLKTLSPYGVEYPNCDEIYALPKTADFISVGRRLDNNAWEFHIREAKGELGHISNAIAQIQSTIKWLLLNEANAKIVTNEIVVPDKFMHELMKEGKIDLNAPKDGEKKVYALLRYTGTPVSIFVYGRTYDISMRFIDK